MHIVLWRSQIPDREPLCDHGNADNSRHLVRARGIKDISLTSPVQFFNGGNENLYMTDLIYAMILSRSVHAALSLLLVPCSLLLTSFPYTTSASIPAISNLDDDDTNWAIAVRKGTTYFHYMETGCYPDNSNPLDMDDLKAMGWQINWHPRPPELERYHNGSDWIDSDVFEKFAWRDPEDGAFCSNEVRRDCESLSLWLPLFSGGPPYEFIIRCLASRLALRIQLLALNEILLPRQRSS